MSDPVWQWQSALFNLAKNDAALSASVGGRIYRHPPARPECPYIYFGDVELAPEPLYSDAAEKITLTAYIVSNAGDLSEILTITQNMRDAVDGKNIAVTGYHVMGVHYGGRAAKRLDPDRRIGEMRWHGLLDPKNS